MTEIRTRDEAIALGLNRYFTGEPCHRHGHIAERYVKGGNCLGCIGERKRSPEYIANHRAQVNQANRGVAPHEIPPPLRAGHCDLCGKPTPSKLSWDHDHDLEELGFPKAETHRGWLCRNCNTGLGGLGDNAVSLMRALDYVIGRRREIRTGGTGA